MKAEIEELKKLYHNVSKHSNYQVLASELVECFEGEVLDIKTRYEKERLECMLSNVCIEDKRVLDIGGNTGYFTLELLRHGASEVYYCEGNQEHAEFVRMAASILGYCDSINIENKYYSFGFDAKGNDVDVCLLLNVLHHVGDDYGDPSLSVSEAKREMIRSLNYMSSRCSVMVFQMGFCWKGDREKPLFRAGTKDELIEFVSEGVKEHWKIDSIYIPEMENDEIVYRKPTPENLIRQDSYGEFLNRPLFIMSSIR